MPRTKKVIKPQPSVSTVSLAEIQAELRSRRARVATLHRRRDRLLAKIAQVESSLDQLGGLAGGGRPKNDRTLTEALVQVLTGKTMRVTDAVKAVQQAGYRTSSPSFRTIVNQALISSGKFKRVGRGQYTAK